MVVKCGCLIVGDQRSLAAHFSPPGASTCHCSTASCSQVYDQGAESLLSGSHSETLQTSRNPFLFYSQQVQDSSCSLPFSLPHAISLDPLFLSSPSVSFPHSPSSIRVEDDHFFLYASLASGRKTYFVSNDELGDHAEQYPPEVLPLLKQWQRSCQVTWDMKTGSLRVCTMVLE